MELTAAQTQVVEHEGGPLRVLGRSGTGKTTALRHRYVRLARQVGAGRVLVVCRSRAAADRFRDDVLPFLAGGFDALPITTFHGVAFDLLRRNGPEPRLLRTNEQWALVRRLLATDGPREWPTLHGLLGRRAFVDEVAAAVQRYEASFLGDEEIRTHADAAGVPERWDELAAFTDRYQAVLDGAGQVDASLLIVRACLLLRDPARASEARARVDHVLVDDFETATFATNRLLSLLTGPGSAVTVAGNPDAAVGSNSGALAVHLERFDRRFGADADVTLDVPFRRPREPRLVVCHHPAVESEAIAGELQAASRDGVAWSDMAVLVRRPATRARAVARALARHGIPVAPVPGQLADEPAVQGLVDLLRWVDGRDGSLDRLLTSPLAGVDPAEVRTLRRRARADGVALEDLDELAHLRALRDDLAARADHTGVADLAHQAFARSLRPLVHGPEAGAAEADERALDAVVAFLDGLERWADEHPDATLAEYLADADAPDVDPDSWRAASGVGYDAVTISSIAGAAGREWDTVVVAGCVEGELPSVHARVDFFDRALLGGPDVPSVAERRRRSLDEERRLFNEVACTRATGRLVLTAAPQPGVVVSRFVEHLERDAPVLPLSPHRPLPVLAPTPGTGPMAADGRLHLSASQLETYVDCPLRWFYSYGLRVRGESGTAAELGSLVHEVLEKFLDPEGPDDRSLARLHEIADALWHDDIARYRPQAEQAHRNYLEWLDGWWEAEGSQPLDVLDVERRFEIEVGPHRVRGSIDRIDRTGDGELRITDYKTSNPPPSTTSLADHLQLAVYHLAATDDPSIAAEGVPTELRLLFLRGMKTMEQEIVDGHADATRGRIIEIADEILSESFEPHVDAHCDYCDFHRLCPLQDEGREVAAGE